MDGSVEIDLVVWEEQDLLMLKKTNALSANACDMVRGKQQGIFTFRLQGCLVQLSRSPETASTNGSAQPANFARIVPSISQEQYASTNHYPSSFSLTGIHQNDLPQLPTNSTPELRSFSKKSAPGCQTI